MQKKKETKNVSKKALAIALLLGILSAGNYSYAADKAAEIDKFFTGCYNRELLNGVALVAEKGNIIYKKVFGLANSEWDIPNGIDTKFYLYTMTQPFTAVLVLQLVEEGKIKLDGVISDYLPYYREDIGKKITIHQLLTHTHGLPDLQYKQLPLLNLYPVKQFIQDFLSRDPEFEAGKGFSFSTLTGYTILGAIIEEVTGKSYEQVLNEKIVKPLNMINSGFIHYDTAVKKMASAYQETTAEKRIEFFMCRCDGSTSLYSTVEDLLLWDRALSGDKLLAEKAKEAMFKEHAASSRSGYTGYGWNLVNLVSGDVKKKIAWQIGEGSTVMWRILDDDMVVIILNNTMSSKLLEMCIGVTNLLYNKPAQLPKRSFISTLNKILTASDIQAAIQEYNELGRDHFDEYNFEESELNTLGDYLLSQKKLSEAVEIFKLNLKSYPNSWYSYARLGEAMVKGNNKEAAIMCYERAITLMPRGEEQAYRDITAVLQKLKEQEEPGKRKQ